MKNTSQSNDHISIGEEKTIQQMGGEAVREKYGEKHFAELQKKSVAAQKKDPEYGKRLSAAGVHARQVKKQAYIKSMIVEKPKNTLMSALLGRK